MQFNPLLDHTYEKHLFKDDIIHVKRKYYAKSFTANSA